MYVCVTCETERERERDRSRVHRTPYAAMASVGFGTVAPAVASSPAARTTSMGRPSAAHVPAATTKFVAAAAGKRVEEKGLFDTIFGALYKEEQLLETDPVLNKVGSKGKATTAPAAAPKKAAEEGGNGGLSLGGFFSRPKKG